MTHELARLMHGAVAIELDDITSSMQYLHDERDALEKIE